MKPRERRNIRWFGKADQTGGDELVFDEISQHYFIKEIQENAD